MIISLIVGTRILLKYFSFNNKELIMVGLAWICLSSPWWSAPFSFLTYFFFGVLWDVHIFFIIGNIFIPVAIICWIYSFAALAYQNLKKILLIVYILICTIFLIFFLIFIVIDIDCIGEFDGTFDARYLSFTRIFQAFAIISALVTGILFALKSMKSSDPKIQWKGRFLLIAFISFSIAAIFDSGFELGIIGVILIRFLLISSAIEYYLGFLLPDRIAKWLIRSV
ncbi:MAG: hypothetical protein ACTSV5_01480 [Promethearchaeota archaeon]